MTQQQWNKLFISLNRKLGSMSMYWQVFDPRKKEKPVAGSLGDDFADIYRDIHPGLLAYLKGSRARRLALREMRSHE